MNAQPTETLPSIFDSRGQFVELTDEQATKLTEEQHAIYGRVAEAYDATLVIEKKIANVTDALHAATRELRAAEDAVRLLPKPSHTDLVRQIARQTARIE